MHRFCVSGWGFGYKPSMLYITIFVYNVDKVYKRFPLDFFRVKNRTLAPVFRLFAHRKHFYREAKRVKTNRIESSFILQRQPNFSRLKSRNRTFARLQTCRRGKPDVACCVKTATLTRRWTDSRQNSAEGARRRGAVQWDELKVGSEPARPCVYLTAKLSSASFPSDAVHLLREKTWLAWSCGWAEHRVNLPIGAARWNDPSRGVWRTDIPRAARPSAFSVWMCSL